MKGTPVYIRVERITRQLNGAVETEFFNSYRSLEDLLKAMPAHRVDQDGNPINPSVSYVFYDALTDELIDDPRPVVTDETPRLCSPGAVDPERHDRVLEDIGAAIRRHSTRRHRQAVGQTVLF